MPPRPVRPGSLERRSEDALLIRSALRGDQAAYKRLMKKYHPALFNLICRLVRNRDEAEDLTQEAFVKAFASLKNFNAEYAFTTWLYKIATNNTIDHIRKRKLDTFSINKPIESGESDYTFELPDITHQPDRELMQGQKKVMIEEAISRLPEKYRRVIILRHNEERDYAEIAKLLKLPIGTVKAHIFRARELLYRQLRTKLSQY